MSADALSDAPFGHQSPRSAAALILQRHWNRELPVDPARIADELGIRVVCRGGPQDTDYPYSGFFQYDGNEPVIEFNQADSHLRQRFTLAHEIGHYALGHRQAPRDHPANFSSAVADIGERHANQFAAELLMPAWAVRGLVQNSPLRSLKELAQAFAVSQAAMGYRLQNLGFVR